MKLGKLAVREDARTLKLGDYLTGLPTVPVFRPSVPSWPMYLNDQIGDCTIAAAAHMIEAWTAPHGEVSLTDQDVLSAYEKVSGYDPASGTNDNGAVELDVLNYWRQTGIGGHRIIAYAKVNLADHAEILAAASLFGGLYAGVELPLSAQTQGRHWAVASGTKARPGSWGGHAIPLYCPTPRTLQVVTWGNTTTVTPGFLAKYFSEAYALVTQDFLDAYGRSPAGLDLNSLLADLHRVTG